MTEFDKKSYGQRWQAETVMSMIKRNQGESLRSKTYWAQNREMMLKVLTHNIGIILLARELFYLYSIEVEMSAEFIGIGLVQLPTHLMSFVRHRL